MGGGAYRRLIIGPMRGSGERPAVPRHGREATALVAALGAGGVLMLAGAVAIFPGREAWGFDFHAYYQAALRLVETGTPYRPEWLARPFDLGPVYGLFVYSPLPAMLVVPLTAIDEQAAINAWFALRVGLLVLTGLLIPASARVRLATFGVAAMSMPVLSDLALGNVSLVVTFLTVLAWRFLDHPIGGLAVAGSLFVRPTMGLFIGWWLIRRRWAPLVAALIGAAAMAAASALFIGLRPYLDYLAILRNIGAVTGVPNNLDLASTVANLGAPRELVSLALVGSFVLAVGAALLSLARDRELSFVVVSMAVLFVSPLLWGHYLTQLLVPAAFLAARGHWWGLVLPLLAWLPPLALPLVGLAGMLAPFLARGQGQPALAQWRRRSATVDRQPDAVRGGEALDQLGS